MGEQQKRWRREIGLQYDTTEQMEQRLTQLTVQRQHLRAVGDAMVREFRQRFPDTPLYLTRFTDRTLNDYRWRRSSAKRWRRSATTDRQGVNLTLDLLGDTGAEILDSLPQDTRRVWLEFEERRLQLNFASACVNYERMRLRDLLERLRLLARTRAKSVHDPGG